MAPITVDSQTVSALAQGLTQSLPLVKRSYAIASNISSVASAHDASFLPPFFPPVAAGAAVATWAPWLLPSAIRNELERRWEFDSTQTNAQPGNTWSHGGLSLAHSGSWTGNWNVVHLFMWTLIVLVCMLAGFVAIALIFWSCGMLDERRLGNLARRGTKAATRTGKQPQHRPQLFWKPLNQDDNVANAPETKKLDGCFL